MGIQTRSKSDTKQCNSAKLGYVGAFNRHQGQYDCRFYDKEKDN